MSKFREFITELESTELSDFERDHLIPATLDRMKFYKGYFEKLIPICDDVENATLIDGAVRQVVSDSNISPSVPTPKVGVQYLQGAKQQIINHWIKDLTEFLADYPDASKIPDQKEMLRFSQRALAMCASIVAAKTSLLSFSLRAYPTIINRVTQEQEYGVPKDIEILAYPFQGALLEMEKSAATLIESFQNWRQNKMEIRKDFAAFLIDQKQHESQVILGEKQLESAIAIGQKQLESAEALNRFQLLVIAFTVVLTLSANTLIEFFKDLTPIIKDWFH